MGGGAEPSYSLSHASTRSWEHDLDGRYHTRAHAREAVGPRCATRLALLWPLGGGCSRACVVLRLSCVYASVPHEDPRAP